MANKRLTLEEVKSRLDSRGIRLIGEYHGVNVWADFECEKGHTWNARVSNVLKRTGCPRCAYDSKSLKMRMSTEDFVKRLSDRNISLIGEYLGITHRTSFKCSKGHTWVALPSTILQKSGCPECGLAKLSEINRLSALVIEERLSHTGLEMLDQYINGYTKVRFKCSFGHIWATQPAHVLSDGNGCPFCADYGYNVGKKSSFYILKIVGQVGDFVGFGVSNNASNRIKVHSRNLSRAGYVIDERIDIAGSGEAVLNLEKSVKRLFKCCSQGVDGFITEAVHISEFNNLVSFARSYLGNYHDSNSTSGSIGSPEL